jgi:glycosyltransferase involved in cell wall biosynthesis
VRPAIVAFCERLDNESFCESVIRELGEHYEVRPCGPGWPARDLGQVDASGARFYLELDAASGNFVRPTGLEKLSMPKFAWLVDTHKKPDFHRALARDMDLTFFAMRGWGHVFETPCVWLPLHADTRTYRPVACEREWDLCFVGSQHWRADPILRIAEKHGLKVKLATTTGPREKSETAAIYARSKLVFNKHLTNDLNFRVFEAMACGRVLLTDAQWNGQYDFFEDGKHYVLYKDERDLEEQILRYLRDDDARARVEREAAAVIEARHSTRARVRQLRDAIETFLAARGPAIATSAPAQVASVIQREPRRWLFFVGTEPASVDRKTYAERIAHALAARGHAVTIARERRTLLPRREARSGEPVTHELDVGPLPLWRDTTLSVAAPLHARLEALVREHGPFDVVVGEGGLGGLVAAPVAERLGLPFVLALETCEVARRENRLTREQLVCAELQHWAARRARAVVVPSSACAEGIQRFYGARSVVARGDPDPASQRTAEAEAFVRRVGLEPRAYRVHGRDDAIELATKKGERLLGLGPISGSVLRALLACAEEVEDRRERVPAQLEKLEALAQGLVARAEIVPSIGTTGPHTTQPGGHGSHADVR